MLWLHEALLRQDRVWYSDPDARYHEWLCEWCGAPNQRIGRDCERTACAMCRQEPPPPRALGVVTRVDHERRTITVSGLLSLRGSAELPSPLTMADLRKWTTPWPGSVPRRIDRETARGERAGSIFP